MNIAKIQQEVLKALLVDPKNVKCTGFGEDSVLITLDHTVCWVLKQPWLRLDLDGTQDIFDFLPRTENVVEPDNVLKATDEYRLGGCARRYLRTDTVEEDDVYIDTAKLKFFDHPTLYQSPAFPHLIFVTEDLYHNGETVVVGIVCPVKVNTEN
jgi:hypothetical protein